MTIISQGIVDIVERVYPELDTTESAYHDGVKMQNGFIL